LRAAGRHVDPGLAGAIGAEKALRTAHHLVNIGRPKHHGKYDVCRVHHLGSRVRPLRTLRYKSIGCVAVDVVYHQGVAATGDIAG